MEQDQEVLVPDASRDIGFEHQLPMPDGAGEPDSLAPLRRLWVDQEEGSADPGPGGFMEIGEVRTGDGYDRLMWFRTAGPLPPKPTLHRCAMTYASDLTLLTVALAPHGMRRPAVVQEGVIRP